METNIKIGCSRERSIKDILGYCYTCKELFCRGCMVGHIGHETQKISEFILVQLQHTDILFISYLSLGQ